MKTALTELVEEFEKEFNDPDWQGMETKIWREAIKMLKEKLPQERQQIEALKKEVEELTAKLHEQYKYWELVKEGVLIKQYIESETQNRELRKEVEELRGELVKQDLNLKHITLVNDVAKERVKYLESEMLKALDSLKKERDAYYDELYAKRIEVERLKAVIQGYAPNITDPNDCKQCGGEGGWYEDVAGDGLGSMWISCDECGEDDEPLNPQP
jgi:chromosome segregation ATPase